MIAVYPGSFDPLTNGHLTVIVHAVRVFSCVIPLVAVNPTKQYMFTVEERLRFLHDYFGKTVNIMPNFTHGMVVDFIRERGLRDAVLVRGVRGAADIEPEMELARQNRILAPEIQTVFLPGISDISSSQLKAMASRGEDISTFCPGMVAKAVTERSRR